MLCKWNIKSLIGKFNAEHLKEWYKWSKLRRKQIYVFPTFENKKCQENFEEDN